jgi:hypothetical protein
VASCTKADVRAYAPELTALPDAVIDFWIGEADQEINPDVFGDLVKAACANLTAHKIIFHGAGAAVGIPAPGSGGAGLGAITGISVGQVSAQFASLASQSGLGGANAAALMTTRYGLEYKRLVQLRGGGPWLADTGD